MDYGTLEVATPDGQVRQYPIDVPSVTIGRADGNRVVIDHVSVSRRHAQLMIDSGQVMIEDLTSARGTFIDGQQLPPNARRLIAEGQKLRFGDCEARYLWPRGTHVASSRAPQGQVEQAITISVTGPTAPVAPGARTTATVVITNQGNQTDELILTVLNLPEGWTQVTRPRVTLVPGGRDEVTVTFLPPREAAATAGEYQFAAAATSRVNGVEVRALGRLQVLSFEQVAIGLEPQRSKGDFRVVIENGGNSAEDFTFEGRPENVPLVFAFSPPVIRVAPGIRQVTPLRARTAKRRLWGKERIHRFVVDAKSATAPKPLTAAGELRESSLLYPWRWLLALLLLCGIAGGGYFAYARACGHDGLDFCKDDGNQQAATTTAAAKDATVTTPGASPAASPSASRPTGTQSATPATPAPSATAPASTLSKLTKGDVAAIVNSPGPNDCLFVRTSQSRQSTANVKGRLCDGDRVRLVDGPFAGEGYTWWIVRQESTGLEGYASEGLATGADPRFLGPAQ